MRVAIIISLLLAKHVARSREGEANASVKACMCDAHASLASHCVPQSI